MWGDISHGCIGRPPSELGKKVVTYTPTEVDHFNNNNVNI